jgi:DNA-nicking Smr family endonuclease
MRRRNERPPSEAELTLWAEVARSIRPFAGTGPRQKPILLDRIRLQSEFASAMAGSLQGPFTGPHPEEPRSGVSKDGQVTTVRSAANPSRRHFLEMAPQDEVREREKQSQQATAGPIGGAPLERRLLTALKRGHQPIESVIDLHGMRQDEALTALTGFLHRASVRGIGIVLVVTGKGAGNGGVSQEGQERGILRRMVPHWLRLPDLAPLISGFEPAHQRHGGSGALYIRLRRGPARARAT